MIYPSGAQAIAQFIGGTGPLNKQIPLWQDDGWLILNAQRDGNRWDVLMRCSR